MTVHNIDSSAEGLRARLDSRYHGPLIAFFARRIRDRSVAEDLAQETLLRILGAMRLEELRHAEAYVFTVAANLLKEYRFKLQRFDPEVCVPIEEAGEAEPQLVWELTPERLLLDRDSLQEALALLEELGERTRDIYMMHRLGNMKQKDIAATFGISLSAVEKHVMRAMLHLTARQDRQRGVRRRVAPARRRQSGSVCRSTCSATAAGG